MSQTRPNILYIMSVERYPSLQEKVAEMGRS
jgi:hypothetical protein